MRRPTLRREAQSTSALEGTYAPLEAVLAADEEAEQSDANLREVLNYVRAAEHAFQWTGDGRPLTVGLLNDLQQRLVRGTTADNQHAGNLRDIQVMRDRVDPVVAAGLAHYQFETLHPFNDGNGRIGRLLVVLHLMHAGALTEPTLTVSPWFEARRADYYDRLLGVSADGDWDAWIKFFADGLRASAAATERQLTDLLAVQADLKGKVRAAGLRAEKAMMLVDYTLERPIFTLRQAERHLKVTYARANGLVRQLVEAGILRQYNNAVYDREFTAPDVLAVLLRSS